MDEFKLNTQLCSLTLIAYFPLRDKLNNGTGKVKLRSKFE